MVYRIVSLASVVALVGCGAASPAERAADRERAQDLTPAVGSGDVAVARAPSEPSPHALLGGRFAIEFPAGVTLTRSDPWYFPDRPAHYEGQELTYRGCSLTFAARSVGLLRPAQVDLGEGEQRSWVPSETAEPRLEVITTASRELDLLGESHAALGAVVFEADGNATDLFLWPNSEELEGFEDSGEDDWYAWRRRDPRLAPCYAAATSLLSELLPTLAATRSFEPFQTTLEFGHDPDADAPFVYQGSLPPGWIISSSMAFDTRFDRLHRVQPWAWTVAEPAVRADVWAFNGTSEASPRVARRARLFDRDLAFDPTGTAVLEDPETGGLQYIRLFGTRAQQDELIAVLRTFSRSGAAPAEARTVCPFVIDDADGQTFVRSAASSGSAAAGTLANGTVVVPVERRGRWLRIGAPVAGWLWAPNVARRCAAP